VRKAPGYHDEPLQGKLRDVRSVRLGRSYRLFYRIVSIDVVETVLVEEVNRHDYKEIERLFGR
jgi:toxin HigB-1